MNQYYKKYLGTVRRSTLAKDTLRKCILATLTSQHTADKECSNTQDVSNEVQEAD